MRRIDDMLTKESDLPTAHLSFASCSAVSSAHLPETEVVWVP